MCIGRDRTPDAISVELHMKVPEVVGYQVHDSDSEIGSECIGSSVECKVTFPGHIKLAVFICAASSRHNVPSTCVTLVYVRDRLGGRQGRPSS